MKYLPYEADQAWLLPPSVKDVLGRIICAFLSTRWSNAWI